jgi:molybdopterin-binding protein
MAATSARNRFPGIITAVEKDKLVATVEIMAGPHRVLALITRESVDELGLEPGVQAVARVKATNVFVEVPE